MIEEDKAAFQCAKRHIERLEEAEKLLYRWYCANDPYDFPESETWQKIKQFYGFDDNETNF